MNILVTAIGSMSAECVISKLKEQTHTVVGCDIYPKEWHTESYICDKFYQAPYATDKGTYINFLLEVCNKENIKHIIPLTDLEIDVINEYRQKFEETGITLCMQKQTVLEIARDKYQLYNTFKEDEAVPSIRTALLKDYEGEFSMPCVVKPCNGRSSEGLLMIEREEQLSSIKYKTNLLIQEKKEGPIFTVDYIRNTSSKQEVFVARQELLRTKNGAGLTVKITNDDTLNALVSYIGNKLDINGCINMEFIKNNGYYHLIDINPRFSAGVAFSVKCGYDFINNHVNCFINKDITSQSFDKKEVIMVKKYKEVII